MDVKALLNKRAWIDIDILQEVLALSIFEAIRMLDLMIVKQILEPMDYKGRYHVVREKINLVDLINAEVVLSSSSENIEE